MRIFNNNGYSNWLINNTLKKFKEHLQQKITIKNLKKISLFTLGLLYFGNFSS